MADTATDWTTWLERVAPAALLYARQISPTLADAEDAVHDGFVRFWARRTEARDIDGFFFACVRSAALDRRRTDARRRKRDLALASQTPLFAIAPDLTARQEEVQRALARLPEAQREVVVLKLWGGLTFGQIAESLGEPLTTIAARYSAALKRLVELVSPEIEHGR